MALGVDVRTRTTRVARGIPVDTGTFFVAGKAASGSTTEATLVHSLADFIVEYGVRDVTNAELYDAVDTFFAEGGKRAYIGRYAAAPASGLALFDPDLGPGQVAVIDEVPGSAIYTTLLAHARNNNRFALLDVEVDSTVAEMDTLGDNGRALADAEYGLIFGPWVDVPAPSGVVGGTVRQVPASAVIAGLCARVDSLGNPNRAAAGRDFPLQYVTGFVQNIGKADRESLLDAGVNTFATIFGVLEAYGFQTPVAQTEENPYWQANCSRGRMWLKGRAEAAGEPYVFRTIDGRGRLQMAVKGDIDDVCLELYQKDGLFGGTPQEAFAVEVGASVNTIEGIAQGELHAVAEVRLSPHAKAVFIDLVTIPVTAQVTQA